MKVVLLKKPLPISSGLILLEGGRNHFFGALMAESPG